MKATLLGGAHFIMRRPKFERSPVFLINLITRPFWKQPRPNYTAAAASTGPSISDSNLSTSDSNLEEGVSNLGPIPAKERKVLQAKKPTDILKSLSFLESLFYLIAKFLEEIKTKRE